MAEVKQSTKPKTVTKGVIFATIGAGLLLLIANSAIWINNSIFNTQNFSNTATEALLSTSSRNAIAGEIVNQALQDRPVIKNAVSEPATKFISGLLDTSIAHTAVAKASSRLQIAVTTKNPQNIQFDLSSIKDIATKLINLAGAGDGSNIAKLPDTLVIFDASKVPNFYKLGTIFLWLAPVAALLGAGLLALPHITRRRVDRTILLIEAAGMALTGIIALLFGPLFRPPVLAQVSSLNIRIVVENLYNSFIATFNSQTIWFFILTGLLLAYPVGYAIYRFVKDQKTRLNTSKQTRVKATTASKPKTKK